MPSDIRALLAVGPNGLLVSSNLGIGVLGLDGKTWKPVAGSKAWAVNTAAWVGNTMYFLDNQGGGMGDNETSTLWYVAWPDGTPQKVDMGPGAFPTVIGPDGHGGVRFAVGTSVKVVEAGAVVQTIAGPENVTCSFATDPTGSGPLQCATFSDIYAYDPTAGQWKRTTLPGGTTEPKPISFTMADGQLWAKPYSNGQGLGLYRFDAATTAWKHYFPGDGTMVLGEVRALAPAGSTVVAASEGRVSGDQRQRGDVSVITTADTYVYERDGLEVPGSSPARLLTGLDGLLGGEVQTLLPGNGRVWYGGSDGIGSITLDQLQ